MICDLLIVGGEGDLAFRKLYLALYHLDKSQLLPDCLRVVGISRNPQSPEVFQGRLQASLVANLGESLDPVVSQRFCQRVTYRSVDAMNPESLGRLNDEEFCDRTRDLIVYLATPPSIFQRVCECLQSVGLVRPNTRVVVEKPLGHSRESFIDINRSLTSIFAESQVYRIDHYLGKETVQNLLVTRFANALFEPLWSNKYVDHVQITVAETVGVEDRWAFYEEAGALRDMMQNHLLQLLCLAAMEPPARFDASSVHDEKIKVLNSLKSIDRANVLQNTVRASMLLAPWLAKPFQVTCMRPAPRSVQPPKLLSPSRPKLITGAGRECPFIYARANAWERVIRRSLSSSVTCPMLFSRINWRAMRQTSW